MTKEEVLLKYTNLINNNIFTLLQLKAVDVSKDLYKMDCLKDKSHSVYYDAKTKKFCCPICGYRYSLIELTADIMNLSIEETIQKILVQKLKKTSNEIKDLEDFLVEENEKKELFYKANRRALEIFKENLNLYDKAKDYVYNNRGISQEIVEKFEIGYAAYDNQILNELSKEFSPELLYEVGLVGKNKEGLYYDFFNNRIMFPVFDNEGHVIAFGGRTIGSSPKKYLNTRTTLIFSKSNTLYALDKLITTRRYEVVLVCEGYMDVIAMYQKGVCNVVGNLGTAITKEHLQILKKYTNKPVVMLDGDGPGMDAMKRTIEKVGKVHTVILPDNLDPDEYLKVHSKEEFVSYIKLHMKSWCTVMSTTLLNMDGNIFDNLLQIKQF